MKYLILGIVLITGLAVNAQRDLTPSKKKDAFGVRDLRNLSNSGLQFQLGPTYTFTKLKNDVHEVDPATQLYRGSYYNDPKGRLGVYGEIGMIHFPKKRSGISLALKTVLVSYFDWGLGFKYFRGSELIHLDSLDNVGNKIGEAEETYALGQGNVYGRFSIHKNIKLSEALFLDNTLGINLDYRLLQRSDDYNWTPMTDAQQYTKPFQGQLHYGLGLGVRLKRGSYMVFGARTPILGYQSVTPDMSNNGDKTNMFGKPSFHWYSSRYWPVLFHFKYMFLFEKKAKGCPAVEINEDDRERYRNGN